MPTGVGRSDRHRPCRQVNRRRACRGGELRPPADASPAGAGKPRAMLPPWARRHSVARGAMRCRFCRRRLRRYAVTAPTHAARADPGYVTMAAAAGLVRPIVLSEPQCLPAPSGPVRRRAFLRAWRRVPASGFRDPVQWLSCAAGGFRTEGGRGQMRGLRKAGARRIDAAPRDFRRGVRDEGGRS